MEAKAISDLIKFMDNKDLFRIEIYFKDNDLIVAALYAKDNVNGFCVLDRKLDEFVENPKQEIKHEIERAMTSMEEWRKNP